MNPYFALSAVFLLGLRGIEKKLKLTTPPISHFTPEDMKSGKVNLHGTPQDGPIISIIFRSRCFRGLWKQLRNA